MDKPIDASPPSPLSYATSSRVSIDGWRVLRLALFLWASIVLIRHGTYWGERAIGGDPLGSFMTDPRPLLFAAVEAGTLVMLLITLLPTSTDTLKPVARLAGIFIAANLLSFALDFVGSRDVFAGYGMHLLWQIAFRVQLLVVPTVAIVAWIKSR